MCMITYLPPFVKVPVEGIKNGAVWNDDGHGWAVAADTNLMIRGRHMDAETALDTFLTAREAFPEAPALFHSRWATHGLPLVKNCHPFYVAGRDTVVAHNGVMPQWLCPVGKDSRSDTALMAQEWLGYQTRGTWTRKERKRIGAIIGLGNKLVLLSVSERLAKPKGFIVNQGQGQWAAGGAWFSNGDYQHGYARGRYSSWSNIKDTGDWEYDDLTGRYSFVKGASAKRANATYIFGGDNSCPDCFKDGTVDPVSNLCTECDFCLDCFNTTWKGQCECTRDYTPNDDYRAANAQILAENEASSRIDESLKSIAQHAIRAVDTNPDVGLFKEPSWGVDTADDNLGKALAIYDGDAALDRDKENPLVSLTRGELNPS